MGLAQVTLPHADLATHVSSAFDTELWTRAVHTPD
jgi:putative ABC transport system permease protein